MRYGKRAFTLLELLVVITIILILAGMGAAWIGDAKRSAKKAKCASNMRQIGLCLIEMALKPNPLPCKGLEEYPYGGSEPGLWDPATFSAVKAALGDEARVLTCPAARPTSPDHSDWASCSYAYLGNLAPTYTCTCDACTSGGHEGQEIWTLYWAGVDYTGGHQDDGRDTDFSDFKEFERPPNIVFTGDDQPTVPEHLDLGRWRTQRRLRELPHAMESKTPNVPLLMDLVVLTELPSGDSPPDKSHMNITEANKDDLLYASHCRTGAGRKRDWGMNVFYTGGNVVWIHWSELTLYCKTAEGRHYFGPKEGARTTFVGTRYGPEPEPESEPEPGPEEIQPIAHYKFDEDNGGTTPDAVSPNHATLGDQVNINTSGLAKYGAGALEMTGGPFINGMDNGAVTCNAFSWPDSARTITFWWKAKLPATNTDNGAYVSFGADPWLPDGSSVENGVGVRFDVKEMIESTCTTDLRVEVEGCGVHTTESIDDGEWHFIVVTVPAATAPDYPAFGEICIYVDGSGSNLNDNPSTTAVKTGTGPLVFGDSTYIRSDNYSNRTPNGYLDDFRLYDRVLTQEQISSVRDNSPVYESD